MMVGALCGECNNILQHVCLDVEKTAFYFQVYLKLATNDINFFFQNVMSSLQNILENVDTSGTSQDNLGFVVVAQFQIVDTIS